MALPSVGGGYQNTDGNQMNKQLAPKQRRKRQLQPQR
jgi:hypothetical protein